MTRQRVGSVLAQASGLRAAGTGRRGPRGQRTRRARTSPRGPWAPEAGADTVGLGHRLGQGPRASRTPRPLSQSHGFRHPDLPCWWEGRRGLAGSRAALHRGRAPSGPQTWPPAENADPDPYAQESAGGSRAAAGGQNSRKHPSRPLRRKMTHQPTKIKSPKEDGG